VQRRLRFAQLRFQRLGLATVFGFGFGCGHGL
jgi:hypothetical protein